MVISWPFTDGQVWFDFSFNIQKTSSNLVTLGPKKKLHSLFPCRLHIKNIKGLYTNIVFLYMKNKIKVAIIYQFNHFPYQSFSNFLQLVFSVFNTKALVRCVINIYIYIFCWNLYDNLVIVSTVIPKLTVMLHVPYKEYSL